LGHKKNQNSILFLTTLGVYIGLLMAGATPGIVAQQSAAMTRNFELSEEVEVKDDLDLDPDVAGVELGTDGLEALLSETSTASILHVFLAPFAVDPTPDAVETSAEFTAARRDYACSSPQQLQDFFANDVSRSANITPASLPRSGLA
jgi:hypothetical protein